MTAPHRDDHIPSGFTHLAWCAPDACTADGAARGSHLSDTQWLRAAPPCPEKVAVTRMQPAWIGDESGPEFVDLGFHDENGEIVTVPVEMGLAQELARTLLDMRK